MKLFDLKKQAKAFLASHGVSDNESTVLEMLFEHCFGFSRNFLLTENEFEIDVSSDNYKLFIDDINRLAKGDPIQHIVGYADFCALKFKVTPDVLIPRQETELLVKIALYRLSKMTMPTPRVLDLCSGSGGIGISVKKYCPRAMVTLSDISEKALSVSKENAEKILGSSKFVDYLEGDFLAPAISKNLKFDVFLSNPPYVKTADVPNLPSNVYGHDPTLALDGGESGIVPYEKIIPDLPKVMIDGGVVCFEIGETEGHDVAELLKRENCFETIEIVKDLCGCDRFVCAIFSDNNKTVSHDLNEPCNKLSGIGKKSFEALNNMGVFTVRDLISFYPRKYENRTYVKTLDLGKQTPKMPCTYKLVIRKISEFGMYGKKVIALNAFDETGGIKVVFFNMPYVRKDLFIGQEYYFYGTIEKADTSYPEIINPRFVLARSDEAKEFLKIHPVYKQRQSIKNEKIRKAVYEAVTGSPDLPDFSKSLRDKYNLISRKTATFNVHFPENTSLLESSVKRISFDELLNLSIGINLAKEDRDLSHGSGFSFKKTDTSPLRALLPYTLTSGQEETISAIFSDMENKNPMNRLIIGDVGSGKTAIALFAVFNALKNGKQVAFMVPSTVLAEQHYGKLKPILTSLGFETLILLGSTKASERKIILGKIKSGESVLVIGTHSLIQDGVEFKNLGLVVTDEQHRFGVSQRKAIIGNYDVVPDVLLLTATPIPRTLAIVLYGDIDISYLKEKPSGRKDVVTSVVSSRSRKSVYSKALSYVEKGEQVFVVHSCIEDPEEELDFDDESNKKPPISCISNHAELSQGVFAGIRTAVLHGKMKDDEKNEIMQRFAAHEIDVLFSTTVIEVGIDVKNASLMIIENAEHFGLSQLHQLRGRVGRGNQYAECILISETPSENERLKVMASENDGFKIAEEDLRLRGPGEFFGTMQSGVSCFSLANPILSPGLLESANACAKEIISIAKKDKKSPEYTYVSEIITESERLTL